MAIRNWMKMLLAVLLGNLIYFLILPQLPDELRHHIFRVDVGLILDMATCAIIYVLIRKVA
jgi:hypothetical protein